MMYRGCDCMRIILHRPGGMPVLHSTSPMCNRLPFPIHLLLLPFLLPCQNPDWSELLSRLLPCRTLLILLPSLFLHRRAPLQFALMPVLKHLFDNGLPGDNKRSPRDSHLS